MDAEKFLITSNLVQKGENKSVLFDDVVYLMEKYNQYKSEYYQVVYSDKNGLQEVTGAFRTYEKAENAIKINQVYYPDEKLFVISKVKP
jgi:hypothetical protein